jgi:hypothetical protein
MKKYCIPLSPIFAPLIRSLGKRLTSPLLFLGAGLVLIHPCAGQSGTWTETGSLPSDTDADTGTMSIPGPYRL